MSSARSRSRLLDILMRLGAVSKDQVAIVDKEIEARPSWTTADIILELDIASPEDIRKAEEIQRELGSSDLLKERLKQAENQAASLGASSSQLSDVADRLAKK